jgi:hypothetical protein
MMMPDRSVVIDVQLQRAVVTDLRIAQGSGAFQLTYVDQGSTKTLWVNGRGPQAGDIGTFTIRVTSDGSSGLHFELRTYKLHKRLSGSPIIPSEL